MTGTAILIRSHFLNQELIALARSFSDLTRYEVIFLVDAAADTAVDAGGFRVVRIARADVRELGVFLELDDVFWRCGDYFLYIARSRFPEFSAFWLYEYDVVVNRRNPASFFEEIDDRFAGDFISSYFRISEPDWGWRICMQQRYSHVYRCFFPLLRISASAIDFLLQQRRSASLDRQPIREIEQKTWPPAPDHWPNDEVFVATTLANNGFVCRDFNDFGGYYTESTFSPSACFLSRALVPADGLLYHSVRSGVHYLRAAANRAAGAADLDVIMSQIDVEWPQDSSELQSCLRQVIRREILYLGDDPERILVRHPRLSKLLHSHVKQVVAQALVCILAERRMVLCLEFLRRRSANGNWPEVALLRNIALARPAWQSSVCYWSHIKDARLDAEGGNNGSIDLDYGFHTDAEQNPWWAVDLQIFYTVDVVEIYNRRTFSERLSEFRLLSSLDGMTWTPVYRGRPADAAETDAASLIRVTFEPGIVARFLKVELEAYACLHFREFGAYGKEVYPPPISRPVPVLPDDIGHA